MVLVCHPLLLSRYCFLAMVTKPASYSFPGLAAKSIGSSTRPSSWGCGSAQLVTERVTAAAVRLAVARGNLLDTIDLALGAFECQGGERVLDERKLTVLRAIVQDYVSTTEPVGSKSLVDRHHFDVSPATIRNDMAVLEEQGFIAQPHTSAGRIPTEKGYRLFVDRLSSVKPLSAAERRAIESFLAGAYSLDDVVMRTVRLLVQLTRQVAVVQYPSLTRSAIRHIELVPLAPQKLLLVLITDTGRVEQCTVDLPNPWDDAAVSDVRTVVNARLGGRKLAEAAALVTDLSERVPAKERANANAVFSVLLASLIERNEEKIVFGGAANLAASDFSKGLREVLEALEEQVVLMRLLGEATDPSILTVTIGSENRVAGLQATSVVSTGYGSTAEPLAKLAVLGPTRMDYPGTMGAVRAVARYVGHILMES